MIISVLQSQSPREPQLTGQEKASRSLLPDQDSLLLIHASLSNSAPLKPMEKVRVPTETTTRSVGAASFYSVYGGNAREPECFDFREPNRIPVKLLH